MTEAGDETVRKR